MKMASVDDPFYRDNEADRDDMSFRMFKKPYKESHIPRELRPSLSTSGRLSPTLHYTTLSESPHWM